MSFAQAGPRIEKFDGLRIESKMHDVAMIKLAQRCCETYATCGVLEIVWSVFAMFEYEAGCEQVLSTKIRRFLENEDT